MQYLETKYTIDDVLGQGKFGTVYKGTIKKTGEPVAIKMESLSFSAKMLKHETTILSHLYTSGCRCVPYVFWYGIYKNNSCLVMNYYSCSLDDYSKTHELTKKQLNQFMAKSIELLENIHTHYVVHRDIKPHNFMIGFDKDLYIIDFGLASIYVDEYKKHIPDTHYKEHVLGSPRYMSYNIYNGKEAVRRDDFISLGYMYLYLNGTPLPWDSVHELPVCNDESYNELHIMHYKNVYRKSMKEWENVGALCSQINQSIYDYLQYCYRLSFDREPNYSALKQLFL
jgi:serine/threonine protein kinase